MTPILAIETSCDDTCAAVLDGPQILSNVISSQHAAHASFGGVVPEVAARHHLELTTPVVQAALEEAGVGLGEIEAIAATAGPGLIGALLVGVSTAKAIAAARRLPLIPVNHLQGHVAANFLEPEPLEPPFLCLVASGGHTLLAGVRDHHGHEVLGQTLDDAAGEAFDKSARLLGLGFPGGPALEKEAEGGTRPPSRCRWRWPATPASTSASAASRPRWSTAAGNWARRGWPSTAPTSPPPFRPRSSGS